MEIWKNVTMEPFTDYMISNKGRLKNKSGRIMKTTYDKHGYERLTLNCKGVSKTVKIHKLVADAFLIKPENAEVVNHIDGNKKNNFLENLEWVTQSENLSHAIRTGLKKINGTSNPANKHSEDEIRKVCELLLEGNLMHKEIVTKVFGSDLTDKEKHNLVRLVGQIKRKERWKDLSDEYFKSL